MRVVEKAFLSTDLSSISQVLVVETPASLSIEDFFHHGVPPAGQPRYLSVPFRQQPVPPLDLEKNVSSCHWIPAKLLLALRLLVGGYALFDGIRQDSTHVVCTN